MCTDDLNSGSYVITDKCSYPPSHLRSDAALYIFKVVSKNHIVNDISKNLNMKKLTVKVENTSQCQTFNWGLPTVIIEEKVISTNLNWNS